MDPKNKLSELLEKRRKLAAAAAAGESTRTSSETEVDKKTTN